MLQELLFTGVAMATKIVVDPSINKPVLYE